MMKTQIQIDAVRLDGLNLPPQRVEPVKQEALGHLGHLIRAFGVPEGARAGRRLPQIKLPPHGLHPDASDREIGRVIAQAIYQALG